VSSLSFISLTIYQYLFSITSSRRLYREILRVICDSLIDGQTFYHGVGRPKWRHQSEPSLQTSTFVGFLAIFYLSDLRSTLFDFHLLCSGYFFYLGFFFIEVGYSVCEKVLVYKTYLRLKKKCWREEEMTGK